MIKVLIADDHPFVLNGIRHELDNGPGIKVIGCARNSSEIAEILDTTACDVLVTDYWMPGGCLGDGLIMLKALRRLYPKTRIVVVTMLKNPALIRDIQKAGVKAILNKDDPGNHLRPAVHAAYSHRAYVAPSVQALLVSLEQAAPSKDAKLSWRELEVLRQWATGVPLVEIARRTNRSSSTVGVQKSMAMKKLGLNNDYELYQYAETHGLLGSIQQPDCPASPSSAPPDDALEHSDTEP